MAKDRLSLRKQLLLWLLIPQLLLWIVGAILSNAVAIRYANVLIDGDLLQLSHVLLQETTYDASLNSQDAPDSPKVFLSGHPAERLYYIVTRPNQAPIFSNIDSIPSCPEKSTVLNKPIYCFGSIAQQPVRILTILMPKPSQPHLSMEIRIAKNLISRNQIERGMLLTTVVPLSLLILVVTLLIWWGVNGSLRPLIQLQQSIKERAINDLTLLEINNAPVEIQSLSDGLNALFQSLTETIAKQRRFIADAAHQLRTPLAGLKSQTELAMRETNWENLQARLQLVHISSIRSIHLINQLLTLARSEPDRQDSVSKVDMDLVKFIREVTAESVPRALAAHIDLGCNSALNRAPIKANSALLRELLLNLIENALKYTPSDGIVTLRLLSEGPHYVIEVEDNGPGILDADKARVFERFYRGTQTGDGCGLGLAITKEIALRHHGEVILKDAEPHGLIVRVLLPKEENGVRPTQ